ncbi:MULTISPECIES: porin family protein [Rufibacter]|uniref:Outer membrane protein beta-barrel domain-containing protein n=1 Tax=Rufibacter quisquiliarum TaxID=1549639 RepID=A0A839G9P9_9BACT|nr:MULTISPECIES: porin family protein [Rufibacter]MBA9076214.1 hypothetical protein [Rufibacter quisquiliarum]
MKKLAILVAAIFSAALAQAQSGVQLGLKAGFSYSTFTGEESSDEEDMGVGFKKKYTPGFHAGVYANFKITDNFFIRPEALYSMKGSRLSFMFPDLSTIDLGDWGDPSDWENGGFGFIFEMKKYHAKMTLHYLDVPVMARYQSGNLFVEAGPTVSYLVKSKIDMREFEEAMDFWAEEEGDVKEEVISSEDDLRKIDLGYALGAGYQFSNGLELGLRYNGGFTTVFKDDESKLKNSVFQLSLAYSFGAK